MLRPGSLSTLFSLVLCLLISCHKSSHSSDAPPQSPTTPDHPSSSTSLLDANSCTTPLESKSQSETCEVTHKGRASEKYVYIEGTVLFEENAVTRSALVIDPSGKISCTGCGCLDEAKTLDATRISCPKGIISPALINGHDHLTWANVRPQTEGTERYNHRNEWRGGKRGHAKVNIPGGGSNAEIIYGEIRQLMVGTVSIAGSNGADGFLRNLDNASFMEGLKDSPIAYDTFPLEGGGDYDFRVDGCAYSRQPALAYLGLGRHLMHVAEGIDDSARNEFLCLSETSRGGFDAIEPQHTIVHGIGLLAEDAQALAKSGTALVWSPRSNIALYGNTASIPLMKNLGVNIALGTDWVPSGSAHLLREVQCAAHLNDDYWGEVLSDRDLWLMMTAKAATALKVEKQIGRIEKGLLADIAIYRAQPDKDIYRSLFASEAKDTALVLRQGTALYGDRSLLSALRGPEACDAIDVCGTNKALCYASEAHGLLKEGLPDLFALRTKMESSPVSYPLYFCEAPQNEPTCDPRREGEYAGSNPSDFDGDGVLNEQDNCPNLFNAIRPLDSGKQSDADRDGKGDVCDICPFSAEDDCGKAVDDDRDRDGFKDVVDNCPLMSNSDQADQDKDGLGDVCDPCATLANPDFGLCALESITPVNVSRDQPLLFESLKPKALVKVSGVVTALTASGFYLQDESAMGGIYVHQPKGEKPRVGTQVTLSATYETFKGEAQLTSPTVLSAEESSVPAPRIISPLNASDPAFIGQLVTMKGKVTSPAEMSLFSLESFAIGNSFALVQPSKVLLGDTYEVSGILKRNGTTFSIEPRTLADIVFLSSGLPRVESLTTSSQWIELSTASIPTLKVRLDRPAAPDSVLHLDSNATSSLVLPALIQVPKDQIEIDIPLKLRVNPQEGDEEIKIRLGESELSTIYHLKARFEPRIVDQKSADISALVGVTSSYTLKLDQPLSFLPSATKPSLTFDRTKIEVTLESSPEESDALTLKFKGVQAGPTLIQVSLNGTQKTFSTTVRKQDLFLSEIFFDPKGEDLNLEWIEILNTSGAPLDLNGYKIGAGGGAYTTAVYNLKGIIPEGGCIVVGGPLSSDKNFLPQLFQAEAFVGGLQNGGPSADAIGIFRGEVVSGRLPLDVFIYGDTNKDGFLGPDGKVLTPDLPLVLSGASAERQGMIWKEQLKPTPGDCRPMGI